MNGLAARDTQEGVAATLIRMECAALDRWGLGDPGGFLEICALDVVYFDPYQQMRVDGIEALTALYKTYWGQVHVDRYELLNALVQVCGDMAVLTFNYVSYTGNEADRWNCTEVYRRDGGAWRIIQTHWSKILGGR